MKFPIYLDSHATTPVDPRVLSEMLPYFSERFGNAASIDHSFGADAATAVSEARQKVARCINASPDDIIFTSGATESNNIILQGIAQNFPSKNHIITCVTEHKSIIDTCKHLEAIGKKITYIPVDSQGIINLQKLEESISEKTALITVMTANNEIGTIAPIKEIGAIAHKHGVLFHTDATQAVGHIPFDVEDCNIDFASLSGHKIYGPKGVGALYFRSNNIAAKPLPLFFGGGHERGVRSGTLNVPGIIGLAKALELSIALMSSENARYHTLSKLLLDKFQDECRPVELNGHPNQRLCHNINVSFNKVESKALIQCVNDKLAISAGSACSTLNVEPSHVILALGFGAERAHTAIRIGLGRFNTTDEIEFTSNFIAKCVQKLKKLNSF
ncbi:MAG: cysteine desulfurase family protein [Candidatus Bathyarchaeia archaeon]